MCYMRRTRKRVGVRELRQNLSVYLRRVSAGETLEATERARAVAILAPLPEASTSLGRLVVSGRAAAPVRGLLELGWPEGEPVSGRLSGAIAFPRKFEELARQQPVACPVQTLPDQRMARYGSRYFADNHRGRQDFLSVAARGYTFVEASPARRSAPNATGACTLVLVQEASLTKAAPWSWLGGPGRALSKYAFHQDARLR